MHRADEWMSEQSAGECVRRADRSHVVADDTRPPPQQLRGETISGITNRSLHCDSFRSLPPRTAPRRSPAIRVSLGNCIERPVGAIGAGANKKTRANHFWLQVANECGGEKAILFAFPPQPIRNCVPICPFAIRHRISFADAFTCCIANDNRLRGGAGVTRAPNNPLRFVLMRCQRKQEPFCLPSSICLHISSQTRGERGKKWK